jgi:hypothetical protein
MECCLARELVRRHTRVPSSCRRALSVGGVRLVYGPVAMVRCCHRCWRFYVPCMTYGRRRAARTCRRTWRSCTLCRHPSRWWSCPWAAANAYAVRTPPSRPRTPPRPYRFTRVEPSATQENDWLLSSAVSGIPPSVHPLLYLCFRTGTDPAPRHLIGSRLLARSAGGGRGGVRARRQGA